MLWCVGYVGQRRKCPLGPAAAQSWRNWQGLQLTDSGCTARSGSGPHSGQQSHGRGSGRRAHALRGSWSCWTISAGQSEHSGWCWGTPQCVAWCASRTHSFLTRRTPCQEEEQSPRDNTQTTQGQMCLWEGNPCPPPKPGAKILFKSSLSLNAESSGIGTNFPSLYTRKRRCELTRCHSRVLGFELFFSQSPHPFHHHHEEL